MKKTKNYVGKSYRLKGGKTPLSYMLATRHTRRSPLLYFDEEEGINRPLRYARNQKTPFEDEQDGSAILEPVIFEDGMLHVNAQNQVLQQFLHLHPANGSVFEEADEARDAAEELESVNIELNAQLAVRDLSLEKLLAVSRILIGAKSDQMSTAEIKRDMLLFAKNYPHDFLETVSDPTLEVQDKVHQFFSEGLLSFRNNKKDVYYNLPGNKKRMLVLPFGEDPYYVVHSFLQSDDGIEVYKALDKRLSEK